MGRFTGVVLALALAVGCAKSKEGRMNTEPTGNAGPGGNPTADQATDQPKTGATPTQPITPSPGNAANAQPSLDPSVKDDPNSAKQQARANGMLGAADQFDDSPIEKDTRNKTGSASTDVKRPTHASPPPKGGDDQQQPLQVGGSGGQGEGAQIAVQLDSADAPVKTALDAQHAAIGACKKAATGVLEITITVDAGGKITSAKIAASSTLKNKATSDCVLAIVKKLQLGKGAKVTAPIRITF